MLGSAREVNAASMKRGDDEKERGGEGGRRRTTTRGMIRGFETNLALLT